MTTFKDLPRSVRLGHWMTEHAITYREMSERLGCSYSLVHKLFQSDTIPTKYHVRCIELGFPADLLPIPYDKPKGRPQRSPQFPGLTPSPALVNN